jgi:hypothetical protein
MTKEKIRANLIIKINFRGNTMNNRISLALVMCASLLAGCAAPQQAPIQLSASSLSPPPSKIGIAMTVLPKVDTEFPGAACLLCYATASIANSSLTAQAHTLPYEDLVKMKELIADILNKKGSSTTILQKNIDISALPDFGAKGADIARKDFSSLKTQYGIDKVLVVNLTTIGFVRQYSSYIPNSDPKANIVGTAYIVDLNNNKYDWYQPINIVKSAEGQWDEPPKYPGLTNAYFQVVELTKDNILSPLSK